MRLEHRDVSQRRRFLRRQHPGFEFVDDSVENPDTGVSNRLMAVHYNSLPSLIRSGLRATSTDHPEQSIGEKRMLKATPTLILESGLS